MKGLSTQAAAATHGLNFATRAETKMQTGHSPTRRKSDHRKALFAPITVPANPVTIAPRLW
jgi:hypothetical protein